MTNISRRAVLRGSGAMGVALFTPLGTASSALAVALPTDGVGFLTPTERELLAGLVDRFLPGPPEDPEPGPVQVGVVDAIDALLAAFDVDPPLIFAGAPFSDRGGHPVNHFEDFLPLDPYEQKAWRLRILGSNGDPALEFNGAVPGHQQVYRTGLAALAAEGFDPGALGPLRDLALQNASDPAIGELVDLAVVHTISFMYGAPEYGGNRDLAAWETIGFDGDVHPTGYTAEQVEMLDPGDELDTLVLPPGFELDDLLSIAALAASDAGPTMLASAGGNLSTLRTMLEPLRSTR